MNTKSYRKIYKAGYWSGLTAFSATIAFVIVQTLQLLRVITFPWDEILIYSTSLCIVVPFLLEMLALYHTTPEDKKFWSHAALIFTILYSIFVTANYAVQLFTVVPAKINGTLDTIRILEQSPHSMFWDFDALGYIFMGFATLTATPAIEKNGFQRWTRYAFFANALTTPLITFVYFYPVYSERLLLFGLPWVITAPLSMLTLAIMFRNKLRLMEQDKFS